jgi:hypothetical protein
MDTESDMRESDRGVRRYGTNTMFFLSGPFKSRTDEVVSGRRERSRKK